MRRPAHTRRDSDRDRPFRVIFQDRDLIVVDKQAGILCEPFGPQRSRDVRQLLDAMLSRSAQRALTVHRIDRYTSGLLVFATQQRAKEQLVAQFLAHTPRRLYLALVRGVPEQDAGTLRHRLTLTRDGFRQVVVAQGGTPAVCHFQVEERIGQACLLQIELETGLKNQIRVQLAAAGLPVVGDRHYRRQERDAPIARQALHAWRLQLAHPRSGEQLRFEAEPPSDFQRALRALRATRR